MLRRCLARLQQLAPSGAGAPVGCAFTAPLPCAAAASPLTTPPPELPGTHGWWRCAQQLAARRRNQRAGRMAGSLGRKTLHATVVQYPHNVQYYTPRKAYVYDLNRTIVDRVELPGEVFNVPVRLDILQRVVRWQRAKKQQGTHKVKTRAEVRGGGRKPWKQKGTGRARHGSIRSPLWRGGGVVHGPVPRSHAHRLPKKVRRLGLKCALSAKAHEGRLMLVDSLAVETGKTKELARQLAVLLEGQPRRSVLLVDVAKDGADGGLLLRRASGNLQGVEVLPQIGANVYSLLRRDVLVLTVGAAEALIARLCAPINRLGASGRAYEARMRDVAGARAAAAAGTAATEPARHAMAASGP